MTPEYSPISLDYAQTYQELLNKCGSSRASDYSFGNIWGWAEHYGLEWRSCGGLCWLRQTRPHTVNWAPVGDWEAHEWNSCAQVGSELTYIRVPEKLVRIWQNVLPPKRINITEARGQWDYLYSPEELATLPGNRFHNKKNLLNQFKKNYHFSYAAMTSDCVEAVLKMQDEWIKWREIDDSPSLLAENKAVYRVLESWDAIPGLSGGAIHVDGRVVAYTVGESICADTVVVHFEKGMPGFKGIYQAINNCYAQEIAAAGQFKYINREQDLDDEGLRKAKESYNPLDYVKKFSAVISPA